MMQKKKIFSGTPTAGLTIIILVLLMAILFNLNLGDNPLGSLFSIHVYWQSAGKSAYKHICRIIKLRALLL